MKQCALLTCENLDSFVHDEHYLENALSAIGWSFKWIPWKTIDDQDWSQFDLAIVRTTWDYIHHLPLFIAKLKTIEESSCQLINSLDVIRWNSQKKYLQEITKKGLNVVPTRWVDQWSVRSLPASDPILEAEFVIIKPQVGAGSYNTFKISPENLLGDSEITRNLLDQPVMIQPFLENVSIEGEYSAHFFAKTLSHTILKKPKAGDFRSQEEYGSSISAAELSAEQKQFCKSVLDFVPFEIFFARVDFVKAFDGKPQLMELELIEPSLYFRFSEKSADLFVSELQSWLGRVNKD